MVERRPCASRSASPALHSVLRCWNHLDPVQQHAKLPVNKSKECAVLVGCVCWRSTCVVHIRHDKATTARPSCCHTQHNAAQSLGKHDWTQRHTNIFSQPQHTASFMLSSTDAVQVEHTVSSILAASLEHNCPLLGKLTWVKFELSTRRACNAVEVQSREGQKS